MFDRRIDVELSVARFRPAVEPLLPDGGLDRAKALDILTNGAPGSPLVKAVSARMTTPDFTPNFPLRLMAKDLGYVIREGDKLSVELLTAAAALEDFQRAIAAGHGEKDIAAVVEPLRAFEKNQTESK